MRILQINSVVNTGSTGRITEEIGNIFIKNGHESYIAYGRKALNSKSELIKIGNTSSVYRHGIQTLLTDKHCFFSVEATKQFIIKIESLKPDVVLLHNLHGYYINIELLFNYFYKKNIPVVWTLFDCWAFTGHCTYFDDVNCEKWVKECFNCPKTNKYPKAWVDNSTFNYNQKKELFTSILNLQIVTHSKWLSGKVQNSFLKKYKVNVTPSAVDINQFEPTASNLKEKYKLNKYIILGCANIWNERKGFEDFLKLSKKLDADFTIVLIGLSKSQLKNLPKNILGIQRTESIKELAQWYTLATVFVNPTTQDNFPTTNIEALACGTPVITYDTGGSPEAIDENTGRIVDKNDVDSLKEKILEFIQYDMSILSEHCRKRALAYYDKDKRYMDYLNICEKMILKNN